MSAQGSTRLFEVITRLNEALRQPGGMERDRAIARAQDGVEKLRPRFCVILDQEILGMVQLLPDGAQVVESQALEELSFRAGVVFNLAGTYGFTALQAASASLIDLITVMRRDGNAAAPPLMVHVLACKLLSPQAPVLSRDDGDQLVAQLGRVVARYLA